MIRHRLKKYAVICMAVIMLLSMAGCGNGRKSSTAGNGKTPEFIENKEDVVYSQEEIDITGIEGEINEFVFSGDKLYFCTSVKTDKEDGEGIVWKMYAANSDGTNPKEIPLPEIPENTYVEELFVNDANEIKFVLCKDNGENSKESVTILKIDESGKELEREDVTKSLNMTDDKYLIQVLSNKEGKLFFFLSEKVVVLDAGYEVIAEVEGLKGSFFSAAMTKEGGIVCGGWSEQAAVWELDVENQKWSEPVNLDGRLISGSGSYDFYYRDSNGIWGYILSENKAVKLIDFTASGILPDDSGNIIVTGNDMMLGFVSDGEGKSHFVKYTKADASEILGEKSVITVGLFMDNFYNISENVVEFNKNNKEYMIEFKHYSDEEKMAVDIIAGNAPDVIIIPPGSRYRDIFIEKGVLEDLVPFYDKDPDIGTEDIIPSLLEAMKVEDKLYYVAPFCRIDSLVGNSKVVGTETGWTFEDMLSILKKNGNDMKLFYMNNKSDMLHTILGYSIDEFIDWKKGECSFDSQEFRDILEICNGGSDDESPVEGLDAYISACQSGKVLTNYCMLSIGEIQVEKQLFGDDISLIGFPAKDKEGSYFSMDCMLGIYSKSKVKDGAWEFIRTYMTKEFQAMPEYLYTDYMIPSRSDVLDMKIKLDKAAENYTDELGQEMDVEGYREYGNMYSDAGIQPATQKEVDLYLDCIKRTKKLSGCDYKIVEIVIEEAQKYFAGDKSLDETVKIIQNRVKTYVGENL